MHRTFALALSVLTLAASNAFAADDSVAAQEWSAYMETLAPLGERIVNLLPASEMKDPQLRQEVYRKLYSTVAHGYFGAVYANPEAPDFVPFYNQAFGYLVANPDDVYYEAPIRGDGVYKISGYRGTVRYVSFSVGSASRLTGAFGPTLADYDLDDLKVDKRDGSFEVILSQTRPQGYAGNWWKLDAQATYLQVRQIAYDWLREVDGRFAIERLDRPAAPPRLTAAEIESRLRQVAIWADSWSRRWLNRDNELVNKVVVQNLNAIGGLTTQQYYEGMFDIGEDEALILETEIPKRCRYWNIQLGDPLWVSIDYLHRQSNLNGYTARLDKDGKFRAVISSLDPAIPNWLDTAGYRKGYIFGRWTHCSSQPVPKVTKVKLIDLRAHLPADTPVVSAEARDASLRLRRKGAQLRRRW